MTAPAVTVPPDARVEQVAKILLDHRISAVPVVDNDGRLAGIVSEGDLVRRPEAGTLGKPSWWLSLLETQGDRAENYLKTRGRRADEVMTRDVVSVDERTPVDEIAALLEKHQIKRVPVVREGKVLGIVSRANLLQALAVLPPPPDASGDDASLRERVVAELRKAGLAASSVNVLVREGAVRLWGAVGNDHELRAARLAARTAAPGHPIEDHLRVLPGGRIAMWE